MLTSLKRANKSAHERVGEKACTKRDIRLKQVKLNKDIQ